MPELRPQPSHDFYEPRGKLLRAMPSDVVAFCGQVWLVVNLERGDAFGDIFTDGGCKNLHKLGGAHSPVLCGLCGIEPGLECLDAGLAVLVNVAQVIAAHEQLDRLDAPGLDGLLVGVLNGCIACVNSDQCKRHGAPPHSPKYRLALINGIRANVTPWT